MNNYNSALLKLHNLQLLIRGLDFIVSGFILLNASINNYLLCNRSILEFSELFPLEKQHIRIRAKCIIIIFELNNILIRSENGLFDLLFSLSQHVWLYVSMLNRKRQIFNLHEISNLKKTLQFLQIKSCLREKKCYFCTRNNGEVHRKYWFFSKWK